MEIVTDSTAAADGAVSATLERSTSLMPSLTTLAAAKAVSSPSIDKTFEHLPFGAMGTELQGRYAQILKL